MLPFECRYDLIHAYVFCLKPRTIKPYPYGSFPLSTEYYGAHPFEGLYLWLQHILCIACELHYRSIAVYGYPYHRLGCNVELSDHRPFSLFRKFIYYGTNLVPYILCGNVYVSFHLELYDDYRCPMGGYARKVPYTLYGGNLFFYYVRDGLLHDLGACPLHECCNRYHRKLHPWILVHPKAQESYYAKHRYGTYEHEGGNRSSYGKLW